MEKDFYRDLMKIVSLKPELFENNDSIAASLDEFERLNDIVIPEPLKLLYTAAFPDSRIYGRTNVRFLPADELSAVNGDKYIGRDKYGTITVFARSADNYYVYGYSYRHDTVLQSHGELTWNSYIYSDIEGFIIYCLSDALIGSFDNIISVKPAKLRFSKTEDEDYSALAAESVGMELFSSTDNWYYAALYHKDKKILGLLNMDSRKRLLLACDDLKALREQAGKNNHVLIRATN